LAGGANLLIAVAKLVAGLVTGSAALLSEAAHSFADTLNQVFLMAALHRSDRPADDAHPFGYGMERYFWSLRAAVAIFVLGAGFSVFEGVSALVSARSQERLGVGLGVLAFALVFDGVSLVRALWQVRREAVERTSTFARQLLHEAEPTVRAVVFEDAVAVVGVALAAGGLLADHLLGTTTYDALASIAIGLLLVGVAYTLGSRNKQLLIGRAVDESVLTDLRNLIASAPGIERVVELMTMQLGQGEALLAARVEVDGDWSAADLALVADDIDVRVQEHFTEIQHVLLDPTPGRG
jgi:cation diffusion facilitator family transporter